MALLALLPVYRHDARAQGAIRTKRRMRRNDGNFRVPPEIKPRSTPSRSRSTIRILMHMMKLRHRGDV
jgi:hypothetical protein